MYEMLKKRICAKLVIFQKKAFRATFLLICVVVIATSLGVTTWAALPSPSGLYFAYGLPNGQFNDTIYVTVESPGYDVRFITKDSSGNQRGGATGRAGLDSFSVPLISLISDATKSGEYTIEATNIRYGENFREIVEESSPVKLKVNVTVEPNTIEYSVSEIDINKEENGFYSGFITLNGNFDSDSIYGVSWKGESSIGASSGTVIDSNTLKVGISSSFAFSSITSVQRFRNISFDQTSAYVTMTPKQNSASSSNGAPSAVPEAGYIYDTPDSGSFTMPFGILDRITDTATATEAIKSVSGTLTTDQKQSATGTDLMTLLAEEAIAQVSSQTISGRDIIIDSNSVSALQSKAAATKIAAEQALSSEGIITARDMNAGVKFKTQDSDSVKITIDPSASNTTADNVRVETSDYSISLSKESIKENTADGPLVITIEETGSSASALENGTIIAKAPNILITDIVAANPASPKTTKVTFSKPVTQNVKVSLPPSSGDPKYQAITNSKNESVGGKYNPTTNKIEAKISASDTYTVKENKKDFSDISNKSNEMQNAIRVLASKGVINGTSATTFSPDSPISRAEIAALIMRAISKYSANADGGFSDVKKTDWFFGAAGSAKKHGIMNGTSATIFSPKVNIPKDQIVAVSARVLKAEMKYKSPSNADSLLSAYTDKSSIPSWGTGDIALATRENLVVKRTDGRFNPNATMTRGDAAIILYRMFNRIW